MDDNENNGQLDQPAHFLVFIGVTAAGGFMCKWVSDLTAGPELGGRYDLPFVNSVMWFAFLALGAAALMGCVAGILQLTDGIRGRIAGGRS